METKTTESEFAGKPMLVIHPIDAKEGDKSLIQFGLKKAEAVLASVESIQAFVDKYKKKKET